MTRIAEWEPAHVFGLFSGGGDSIVAAHILSQHPRFEGCLYVNTGTAIEGVAEHVHAVCDRFGWPLYERTPPEPYEWMIRRNGLPGPGKHDTAYVVLKERTFDAFQAEMCSRCDGVGTGCRAHDRIMWIAGSRSGESKRRMRNAKAFVEQDGTQVWVNLILDWTKEDCAAYREAFDLPLSDVAALIHRSGECNCGTYADKGERAMLCALFPGFACRVAEWEDLALENGHHYAAVWGQRPLPVHRDQLQLIPRVRAFACSSCAARMEEAA